MYKYFRDILVRYPQLSTLRGLVPSGVLYDQIRSNEESYLKYSKLAKKRIPMARLSDIFPKDLEYGAIKLSNFLGHWGNLSIESVCKIALIVKYFQPGMVFEFGTYNGMTTLQIALNTPSRSKIYTLDIGDNRKISPEHSLNTVDEYVANVFRYKFGTSVGSYFSGSIASSKITQIIADSAMYDFSGFERKMDFIFIDAAHDYKNKKRDTENAFMMLKTNGIILWDNYLDILYPDLTKYLFELSSNVKLYHLKGTSLVVYWNK